MHLATKESFFVVAYGIKMLQPTYLALEEIYSKIEFNQGGEDLAKKHDWVLG